MLVEVNAKPPLRVNLPDGCGEIVMQPGVPVDFEPKAAIRLFTRTAKGRVRLVLSEGDGWLSLWRFVAEVSSGLERTDQRLPVVLATIGECDQAFIKDNKRAFLIGVEKVIVLMGADGENNLELFEQAG